MSLATIKKLTPDARFMMRAMQTELPLLPLVTKEEQKLFCRMMLECNGSPDFEDMAVKWAAKSDCKKVFPKLPFHLSMYHTKWLRNQRTKAAVAAAAPYKRRSCGS